MHNKAFNGASKLAGQLNALLRSNAAH